MNERTLLALGLLLGVGSGKPPEEWLQNAHGYYREKQAEDPLNGAAAFFAAERGQNPKVNTFFDALAFVSTSLSVGYSDIFAKTEAGKAIAATLMTYGPALAARAFNVPNEAKERAAEGERSEQSLRDIAGKLELILQELQSQRGVAAQDG